jgi:hypothetical protein
MPGDIILMLGISDLFLLTQLISTSIYYIIYDHEEYFNDTSPNFSLFCTIESFFGILGGVG